MTLPKSTTFEFVDRGKISSIVLVHGWATDHRIFESLDLPFNYLVVTSLSISTFVQDLAAELDRRDMGRVSLMGWSLGGFLAYEFAATHSNLINELVLVSIRRKYEKEKLESIREALLSKKRGFLHWFYGECFCNDDRMPGSKWNLFREYCKELSLGDLLDGLDYLERVELLPEWLQAIENITIVHGEYDRISPIEEARDIRIQLNQSQLIVVRGTGHLPFLEKNFGRYFLHDG